MYYSNEVPLAINSKYKKCPQTNGNKNSIKFVYYRDELSNYSLLHSFYVAFCFMLYRDKTSIVTMINIKIVLNIKHLLCHVGSLIYLITHKHFFGFHGYSGDASIFRQHHWLPRIQQVAKKHSSYKSRLQGRSPAFGNCT